MPPAKLHIDCCLINENILDKQIMIIYVSSVCIKKSSLECSQQFLIVYLL